MARIQQETRAIGLSTPLGDDVLVLAELVTQERLGRLFEYEVVALSEDPEIKGLDLLGKNVTIRLEKETEGTRYFNGYVSAFHTLPNTGLLSKYRISLRPWLWFLTRTSDCRIFQELTVPDIIKQIFRDHGFSDFEEKLSQTYRTWEYCVQYRETDFDFVSRLMEHEGIYYYFKHTDGKHTLVFADSLSSHEKSAGYEEIPYFPPSQTALRERDSLWEWSFGHNLQPTAYVLNSFDFKKPKPSMVVRRNVSRTHDGASFEIYDYPGDYYKTTDGEQYALSRLEELSSGFEITQGFGDVRGLETGGLFDLTGFPRDDQNREYLIVNTSYQLTGDAYENTAGGSSQQVRCTVEAIHSGQTYRSPRRTPKPEIMGPQSAVVVGKAGNEIWTDEFGRVKVKFHWDRYSKADDTSSCWIRVIQSLAGQKWGSVWLPRIGQEVLVEFLEGDPDQPIITGRVYNGDNMPPYELPANKTMSGVKTNSSLGGGGFNEIRFEDKKDEEQIFIHAQKNQDIRVENDHFEYIGHDSHLIVKNDKLEHVEANRSEKVDLDHTEEIGKDRHLKIIGKQNTDIGESLSIVVAGDVSEKFNKNHSEVVADDLYIKATNICIEATTNITIKVGGSFIAIEASGIKIGTDGDIVIDAGMNLTEESGMNTKIKAGMNVDLEAGLNNTVKGGAMVTVQGPLVKIN